jgi:GNAT superfamily N-acetyltransferase
MTIRIPVALAERSEADTLFDFEANAPAGTVAALGMASTRLAGGVVLSMRHDPTGFWSKALGFGFDEPVTADLIDAVCDFYRSQGTPMAVLQFAPSVLPGDWADICERAKLRRGSAWVKLARDVDAPADGYRGGPGAGLSAGLRIGPVEAGQGGPWSVAMLRAFGMPEEHLSDMVVSSVGRAGWHPYGVWDGDEVVATATMRVAGPAAQFFGGATVPAWRRRGAQSALLAARAEAARAAGCRWLVAETGAEAPGEHNSSLHNLLRLGFTVVYERQNWIFRP